MAIQDLLTKLQKVRQTGRNRWIACCPAHADRSPSLTITEKDDGVILIKCWAECGAADVLAAVGLEFDVLFPPNTNDHRGKPVRKPWNPADLLEVMAFEAAVVSIAASRHAAGEPLDEAERTRLLQAHRRLEIAAEAIRG